MFAAVGTDVSFPNRELETLEFWKRQDIYAKSLQGRADGPAFVFYEGPPTANGMPHPGHCLTRAIKDLFPRYRTMCGYRCERKAGWDTHGLPVEVEVCKELGIHSKEEIEAYGVEAFIERCQKSVWRYMQHWEQLTERIGFWIDLSTAYVTYHQSYIESVWWSLKKLFDEGLLYRGHKIVWWWAQGGTALSSGEVSQGYREVADPSVYVLFPLDDTPDTALCVWTTTPWTLPSNQFAAVRNDLIYVTLQTDDAQKIIVAADLADDLRTKSKQALPEVSRCTGADLIGRTYRPPFDYFYSQATGRTVEGVDEQLAWRIIDANFVTTDSGTGAVHIAPAFGEVDYEVLVAQRQRFAGEQPQLINAVDSAGKFTAAAPPYTGTWVKDADKVILRDLRSSGRLFLHTQYVHDYPFCWRAPEDPLIQYPRESWFIRTTHFRDAMLENNRQINWLPEHIRDGRFGNFLESNVDWALSRERYWGTPLPIWVCESTGQMEAVGSYAELLAKPGLAGTDVWEKAKAGNRELVDDLKVHKPYIDAVTYDSPFAEGARMRRVSEVIDCWYDSGAMPFAQWGYPHQGVDRFESQFPADFISEALDQTRGWFYTQLAISTMLFGQHSGVSDRMAFPHPFKNCIVLGLMLAEWYESKDGKQRFLSEEDARAACGDAFVAKTGKMSKQLRNYRSPAEIFDKFGADALRWYFYANQPPWNSILYSERAIRDSISEFLLRLWNMVSFFTIYAEIDGFAVRSQTTEFRQLTTDELADCKGYRSADERSELDRWMISQLNLTIDRVRRSMDDYDNYAACTALSQLVDAASNWFVRRSRDRFWAADKLSASKQDAYWTLYEVLITVAKLAAPFIPFLTEDIWQRLARVTGTDVLESIHLCDYPSPDMRLVDASLSERMGVLREIASLGRAARAEAKLKVRQPMRQVDVTLADERHLAWLQEHDDIVREELNVKQIHYRVGVSPHVNYEVLPNFRLLGPKVGKQLPKLKAVLGTSAGSELYAQLQQAGEITIELDGQPLTLTAEEVQIRMSVQPGWTASQGQFCVVVLQTELDDELIREGWARDIVRLIQDLRKKCQCNFTDRIGVTYATEDETLAAAIADWSEYIAGETLAVELSRDEIMDGERSTEAMVGDSMVRLGLEVLSVELP